MSSTLLSVLNVESTNPWHGRLGHVNSQSIKRMMNLNLIPRSSINVKEKCQVCVQAKQPKKLFKSVEKNTKLLELIHSDIYEYNGVLTHGGKRHFM